MFSLLSSHKDTSDISHDDPVAFFALEEDWYALASTLRIFSLNGFSVSRKSADTKVFFFIR